MSLLDQLRKAKSKLKAGETRIVTPDGRELMEKRDTASGAIVSKQIGIRPWGFVGDFRPDLQMAEIMPGLMLSSQDVAQDLNLLLKHGITHIINSATGVPNFYEGRFKYYQVQILDLPSTDILKVLPECLKFIRCALMGGGRVLVHCNAGVSRSATIVLAYLMKHQNMNVRNAMDHVRSIRGSVRPNDGFMRQLFEYEAALQFQRALKERSQSPSSKTRTL